jgi:hypothetical protein
MKEKLKEAMMTDHLFLLYYKLIILFKKYWHVRIIFNRNQAMTECHFSDQSLTIAFLIVPLDDSLEFFVKVAIYE